MIEDGRTIATGEIKLLHFINAKVKLGKFTSGVSSPVRAPVRTPITLPFALPFALPVSSSVRTPAHQFALSSLSGFSLPLQLELFHETGTAVGMHALARFEQSPATIL